MAHGPCDEEIFFASLSKLTISLVGEPKSAEHSTYGITHNTKRPFQQTEKPTWEIVANETEVVLSPPVKDQNKYYDSPAGPLGVVSKDLEWWTVRPEQVVLVTSGHGN